MTAITVTHSQQDVSVSDGDHSDDWWSVPATDSVTLTAHTHELHQLQHKHYVIDMNSIYAEKPIGRQPGLLCRTKKLVQCLINILKGSGVR